MKTLLHSLLILSLLAQWVTAGETAVLFDDSKPGTYLVTIGADGSVTASPLRVVRVGQAPAPTDPETPPPDPKLTPFSNEIRNQTLAVLKAGGTKTTGAALSAVYSLVGAGVADGDISPGASWVAIKTASDAVLASESDRNKWTIWRDNVSAALNALKDQGLLATKDQVANVLKDIAKGMDAATGNTLNPRDIAKLSPATAAITLDTDGKADGILEGIDLAKLIELIKLIIELIKIFGGPSPMP